MQFITIGILQMSLHIEVGKNIPLALSYREWQIWHSVTFQTVTESDMKIYQKKIAKHTAHSIVSWSKLKQQLKIHTYDLMVVIKWNTHIITVTSWWRLKSLEYRVYTKPFVQAKNKEKTQAPRYWPFVKGIHRSSVNSLQKGPVIPKMFPFDEVIISHKKTHKNYVYVHVTYKPTCQTLSTISDAKKGLIVTKKYHIDIKIYENTYA